MHFYQPMKEHVPWSRLTRTELRAELDRVSGRRQLFLSLFYLTRQHNRFAVLSDVLMVVRRHRRFGKWGWVMQKGGKRCCSERYWPDQDQALDDLFLEVDGMYCHNGEVEFFESLLEKIGKVKD